MYNFFLSAYYTEHIVFPFYSTMDIVLYHCMLIALLISFPAVILCSAYDTKNTTTVLSPNVMPNTSSLSSIQAANNQSFGEHILRNQTSQFEEPCTRDTCGAACKALSSLSYKSRGTGVKDKITNSSVPIGKNISEVESRISSLRKRWYLMQNPENGAAYVTVLSRIISMDQRWVHIDRSEADRATMQNFPYGNRRERYATASGIKGMWGCTSVIIASDAGVFISHIWEIPTFATEDHKPQSDDIFLATGLDVLRDGYVDDDTGQNPGFSTLTGQNGVLNIQRRPVVFIITPKTSDEDTELCGINTELQYEAKVDILATALQRSIQSQEAPHIIGYTKTDEPIAESDTCALGKAIVEVDQDYVGLQPRILSRVPSIQGSWRLWVEDRVEFEREYSYPVPP